MKNRIPSIINDQSQKFNCWSSICLHGVKSCATKHCPTPPGPEGSNGRQTVLCDAGKLDLFLIFKTYSHHRWLIRSTSPLQSNDRRQLENGTNNMVSYTITILILSVSLTLLEKRRSVDSRALCFDRIGGRLTRVFPHLEWNLHLGGTFPLRFETQHAHHPILLLKWKRIPHEKRNYHQFYCKRTSYCHS